MGGRTAMMIGMMAIAIAAPYAAGALATTFGGGTVAAAGGAAVTATTTGLSAGMNALIAISQASMTSMALGGAMAGNVLGNQLYPEAEMFYESGGYSFAADEGQNFITNEEFTSRLNQGEEDTFSFNPDELFDVSNSPSSSFAGFDAPTQASLFARDSFTSATPFSETGFGQISAGNDSFKQRNNDFESIEQQGIFGGSLV